MLSQHLSSKFLLLFLSISLLFVAQGCKSLDKGSDLKGYGLGRSYGMARSNWRSSQEQARVKYQQQNIGRRNTCQSFRNAATLHNCLLDGTVDRERVKNTYNLDFMDSCQQFGGELDGYASAPHCKCADIQLPDQWHVSSDERVRIWKSFLLDHAENEALRLGRNINRSLYPAFENNQQKTFHNNIAHTSCQYFGAIVANTNIDGSRSRAYQPANVASGNVCQCRHYTSYKDGVQYCAAEGGARQLGYSNVDRCTVNRCRSLCNYNGNNCSSVIFQGVDVCR